MICSSALWNQMLKKPHWSFTPMSPMGWMTLMKLAIHGWCGVNNVQMWHTRFCFLSPSTFVAHVNGCCVKTCASTKLLSFLCVSISPRIILFNIVGHGMDPIKEVLPPCLRTLHIYTFMTMNLMMRNPMRMTLKNHGWAFDIGWYLPQCWGK